MEPQEKTVVDLKEQARQLVARFTADGLAALGRMSGTDRCLLLAAKKTHLGEVMQRCKQGQGLHVNVPLKRLLEREVKEINTVVQELDFDL